MRPGKVKDLQKLLSKKGFVLNPEKNHHTCYFLEIDGVKQTVYAHFSHGEKEYDKFFNGAN